MKQKLKSQLVKPMILDKEELIEAYCDKGYSKSSSNGKKCDSGYSCGWFSVSSSPEDDDILL